MLPIKMHKINNHWYKGKEGWEGDIPVEWVEFKSCFL